MDDRLLAFLRAIADMVLTGDLTRVGELYAYPLVIYVNGHARVESDEMATRIELQDRRMAAADLGVTRVDLDVLSHQETEDSGAVVLLQRSYMNGEGIVLGTNRVRLFCRARPNRFGWAVEMAEMLDPEYPPLPVDGAGATRH